MRHSVERGVPCIHRGDLEPSPGDCHRFHPKEFRLWRAMPWEQRNTESLEEFINGTHGTHRALEDHAPSRERVVCRTRVLCAVGLEGNPLASEPRNQRTMSGTHQKSAAVDSEVHRPNGRPTINNNGDTPHSRGPESTPALRAIQDVRFTAHDTSIRLVYLHGHGQQRGRVRAVRLRATGPLVPGRAGVPGRQLLQRQPQRLPSSGDGIDILRAPNSKGQTINEH